MFALHANSWNYSVIIHHVKGVIMIKVDIYSLWTQLLHLHALELWLCTNDLSSELVHEMHEMSNHNKYLLCWRDLDTMRKVVESPKVPRSIYPVPCSIPCTQYPSHPVHCTFAPCPLNPLDPVTCTSHTQCPLCPSCYTSTTRHVLWPVLLTPYTLHP